MDAQFGHATDSFDVPGGALGFPSAAGGRFEVDTDHHHFGVEMTIRVIQSPNGQYRNVLHLGNDVEGFAHTIVLNPRNMKLIAGIARDGDSPGDLIADGGHGCESAVDVFLDEDVVVVYTYTDRGQGQNALVKLYINGGIQHGCDFTVNAAEDAALLSKLQDQSKHTNLHLLLGDAPEMRHGVDISIPGFCKSLEALSACPFTRVLKSVVAQTVTSKGLSSMKPGSRTWMLLTCTSLTVASICTGTTLRLPNPRRTSRLAVRAKLMAAPIGNATRSISSRWSSS